jgi:hypothetical protein
MILIFYFASKYAWFSLKKYGSLIHGNGGSGIIIWEVHP